MKHNRRLTGIALATIVLASLCAVCTSVPAAAYVAITPSNGATGVSVNTQITIKWATEMSGYTPFLVKTTGGSNINLEKYAIGVDIEYDPYGHVIGRSYTWHCYPIDASNNRISLEPNAQYNIGLSSGAGSSIISSFTTGSGSTPTWSAWTSLGGQLLAGTGPAAWSSGSSGGRFVTGTNHQLYTYDGATNSWHSLAGYLTSSPAAVYTWNGAIDVFGRGSDGTLWMRSYLGGAWSAWTSLGGQLLPNTGPAASSSGRLDVFVTGTNHQLYHKMFDGSWHAWESLGGYLTSSPAATNENRFVCARGSDGAVWRTGYINNAWQPWRSLGGQIPAGTGPAVSSWNDRIDLFVIGTNGAVYQKWWDAGLGYSNWHSIGGHPTSSPAATTRAQGIVYVFARSSDGTLLWTSCAGAF